MNKLIMLFICLLLAGCQEVRPQIKIDNKISNDLLRLHNWDRTAPLKMSPQLNVAAQRWADKMSRRGTLKHSDLSTIPFNYRGENIASGQITPDQVMQSWRKSDGHYRNIINSNFTHVGFGKSISRKGTTYWCVMFGG